MNEPFWSMSPLSAVVTLQRGFDLPANARRPGRYPVLTSGSTGGFHDEGPVKGPGVVVGRATNLGRPKWSEGDFWPHNTTMFVKDFKGNDARWVFHLFEHIDLSGYNSGSVQPMLNRNYIAQVEVRVPPLPEQRAIAEVLGALDDKIAANTKLAATADDYARSTYTSLATQDTVPLASLFKQRSEVVDPTTVDPDIPYVGLEHIQRRFLWIPEFGSADDVSSNKAAFSSGDVLFGKLRPYFHKVSIAPINGICSTDILVLTPRVEQWSDLAAAAVSSDGVIAEATSASEGTRMPRTSWGYLSQVTVRWPPPSQATQISAQLRSLSMTVFSLVNENLTLAATRDALLPQLMSGKLRVRDAERHVEELV